MNWTMNEPVARFGICMLSSLTGTVVLFVWYFTGRFFGPKGYFHFFYQLLRLLPVCFLFPSAALLLHIPYFQDRFVYAYLFVPTPAVYAAVIRVLAVWRAGTACILAYYLYVVCMQYICRKNRIPCSRAVMQVYEQVCMEMGRTHVPRLYQGYRIKVPVLMGIIHPVIFLPVSDWTQEQLRVIFIHELNHYRQHDLWLKRAAAVLLAVQWMNPAVWMFYRLAVLWSEYACDWLSYPMCGGKKAYFKAIAEMAQERGREHMGMSALSVNTGELEKRVRHIKWCGKKRNGAVWVSMLLAAGMALAGAGSAFAAVRAAGEAYYELFRATDVCIEEAPAQDQTEYRDNGPAPWVQMEIGPIEQLEGQSVGDAEFHWKFEINTLKKTGSIYLVSGKKITVMAFVTPDTKRVRMGIVKSGGKRFYVDAQSGASHSFQVPESGYYQVFAENIQESPVEVSGFYKISESR